MSDHLQQGIFFFNSGRFFDAHEVWEDLWREDQTELRSFYQGLIQAAVGLHHWSRGNRQGAKSQLQKALDRLAKYPETTAGIDVLRLREDLRRGLERLDEPGVPVFRIVVESQRTF